MQSLISSGVKDEDVAKRAWEIAASMLEAENRIATVVGALTKDEEGFGRSFASEQSTIAGVLSGTGFNCTSLPAGGFGSPLGNAFLYLLGTASNQAGGKK
jgi:hypothetical protein